MESVLACEMTDYKITDRNIISMLEMRRTLIHYRDAYDMCAVPNGKPLSLKTDPVEKLRQRYAERRSHPAISFHEGGFFGLRRWFEPPHRIRVQPPLIPVINTYSTGNGFVPGDPNVSFNIGYEFAQRVVHMKDHYGDRGSKARYERSKKGYVVEAHVSEQFKQFYPEYWMPPDNEDEFKKPCDHDFQLLIKYWVARSLKRNFVDVKSLSHFDDNDSFQTRNEKSRHIYIVGDYDGDVPGVNVHGFFFGDKKFGANWYDMGKLYHIDVLHVILSMQRAYIDDEYGLPYGDALKAMRR